MQEFYTWLRLNDLQYDSVMCYVLLFFFLITNKSTLVLYDFVSMVQLAHRQ